MTANMAAAVAALWVVVGCSMVMRGHGVRYRSGAQHRDLPFDDRNTCEEKVDWKKLGPLEESKLPDEIKNHKFLFVLGAHHSGTTLLDLILSENEQSSRLQSGSCRSANNVSPKIHSSFSFQSHCYLMLSSSCSRTQKHTFPRMKVNMCNLSTDRQRSAEEYLVTATDRNLT